MLDDGTAGLHAIKACGGTAVVQDPVDAIEPSMPRSAINHVSVDHVLKIDAMADTLHKLAKPLETLNTKSAPDWLRIEHAISIGEADMQDITNIGSPSAFTCPDCGGALFEMKNYGPLRFLCHTGHAFSLRSLASTHEHVTDEAIWAAIRALQEKEAILRQLAEVEANAAPEFSAQVIAEADRLALFIKTMRTNATSIPPSNER
jgi:two-component system chemotaxis response regulator CheB